MKRKTCVFYAVQVSNFTNRNGKPEWLLRNDACANIAIGIISTILEKYSDEFEFIVKMPFAADCDDVNDLYELFDPKYHDGITFYREEMPISPVTSRFNFDFRYHTNNQNILSRVDVMINDENTLTKNWRVFFDSIGKRVPIVSTNYFMDSPISPKSDPAVRYYERQMESLIASDMFSYPVQSALDEALEAYDFMFKDRKWLGIPTIWNIGAYYAEIQKHKTAKTSEKPIIYFGNRITDTAGRYTNWHLFAEAIGKLSERIDPNSFEAVVLNPTRKVTDEQMTIINDLSKGHVKVMANEDKFTREDYVRFINNAHISCNLFTNEVHGGLTHVEAMMAGNIMIAPALNDYLHKYEDSNVREDYPFLLNCENRTIDMNNFVDTLEIAIKTAKAESDRPLEFFSELNRSLAYKYASYEMSAEIITKDLRTLIDKYSK